MKAVYMSPNCLQKPYVYNFFGGQNLGIFNAPVHLWKKDRRAINPTFNNRILQSFVPVFNTNVDILVDTLRPNIAGGPFDIGENIAACTLDMVCGKHYIYNLNTNLLTIHWIFLFLTYTQPPHWGITSKSNATKTRSSYICSKSTCGVCIITKTDLMLLRCAPQALRKRSRSHMQGLATSAVYL